MPTKEQARERISILVDRFNEHVDEYRKGAYNEHQTRVRPGKHHGSDSEGLSVQSGKTLALLNQSQVILWKTCGRREEVGRDSIRQSGTHFLVARLKQAQTFVYCERFVFGVEEIQGMTPLGRLL